MKKETKKEILIYLLIIIVIVFIRSFIVTPVRVNGSSMDTTLEDKEIMILNKINYRFNDIERFDIVVIKEPDSYLIKRVIGLPNEKLEFKNNKLYVNDKLIDENFTRKDTDDFNINDLGYDVIPDNCYFVMGDNRTDSLDSRVFGCFDRKLILGRANLVLFPFNNFGYKN